MELLVERVDVWAATIEDKVGGLAAALGTLRDAGADLQFVLARRAPEAPGKGMVFVAPLQNDKEVRAASTIGFNIDQRLHSIRIMGGDRPGLAADLSRRFAEGGVNLRGFVASVIGTQFVAYVAVDSLSDAERLIQIAKAA